MLVRCQRAGLALLQLFSGPRASRAEMGDPFKVAGKRALEKVSAIRD